MRITGYFSIVLCCAHPSHPGKDHLAVTTDRSCRLRDAELHMAPWHQTASNGHHGRHGPELSGFILWKSWKSTDQSSDLGSWFYGPHAKKKTFFCKNKHKSSKSIYHSQATVRTPSICLAPAMALTLTWASCMATEILTTRHILVVLELTCPPHPLKHWSEQESSASPAFFRRPLSLRY